jgi:acyl-[acyl-carrier-protein]-phospholipid O-acyltransferase/long-chain-fatty-acid--[acyl-carrier-protein] ligase
MVPSDFFVVPSIPLLGSGKPDYVAALALAKERLASRPPKPDALIPEPAIHTVAG